MGEEWPIEVCRQSDPAPDYQPKTTLDRHALNLSWKKKQESPIRNVGGLLDACKGTRSSGKWGFLLFSFGLFNGDSRVGESASSLMNTAAKSRESLTSTRLIMWAVYDKDESNMR